MKSSVFIALTALLLFPGFSNSQYIAVSPETIHFGEISVGYPTSIDFKIKPLEGEDSLTIIVLPPEEEVYSLSWSGRRGLIDPAVEMIRVILAAANQYAYEHYNRGFYEDPSNLEVLIEEGYLEILEDVGEEWEFWLVGRDPITQIEAVSKEQFPEGAGNVLLYDVEEGSFGYNAFNSGYFGDAKESVIVQNFLGATWNSLRMYRADTGEDPESVDELLELEYLWIPTEIRERWNYEFEGIPVEQIHATSNNGRRFFGDGKRITFDIETAEFITEDHLFEDFRHWLWEDSSSVDLNIHFDPVGGMDYSSDIIVLIEQNHVLVDSVTIPVIASGTLEAPFIDQSTPGEFVLYSAFPNPFNNTTTIEFEIEDHLPVELAAYTLTGQKIATLYEGTGRPGLNSVAWNAADLSTGTYLLKLSNGRLMKSQRVYLLK